MWWLRLGIQIERIKSGHPQQNGRHERMHLTLKREATKPTAANVLQQARFDDFITRYNTDRPHQALEMKVPADVYARSPRVYRGLEHDQTMMVTGCGRICFRCRKVNLSHVFAGRRVGVTQGGFRLPSPRNWMTDGCRDERTASNVPKSAVRGHDDSTLDGSALEDHLVVGVLQSYCANVDCIMTGLLQESGERWRKSVVDQELHSPAARGSARSRTASAAKSSASRTSSASRSGYSSRMPSVVCPSATRATTVATGILRPRRHGTPPIWRGLVVIRLNSILTV